MALPSIPSIIPTSKFYQLALQALYAITGQGTNSALPTFSITTSAVALTQSASTTVFNSATTTPKRFVTIGNPNASTIYINTSGAATASSLPLAAGQSITFPVLPSANINAYTASASQSASLVYA